MPDVEKIIIMSDYFNVTTDYILKGIEIVENKEEKSKEIVGKVFGSLTLAHSQNSQMSFMYGFFFVKFLFFTVVCVVIVI